MLPDPVVPPNVVPNFVGRRDESAAARGRRVRDITRVQGQDVEAPVIAHVGAGGCWHDADRHGGAFRHRKQVDELRLRHLRAADELMEGAEDRSAELPVFREPDYEAERGRGLHIISALAAELGWYHVLGGKVVWVLL